MKLQRYGFYIYNTVTNKPIGLYPKLTEEHILFALQLHHIDIKDLKIEVVSLEELLL